MSTRPKSVRSDLGEVIGEVFSRDWLLEFAETIKGMTTGVWGAGSCPECGSSKKVLVQVPDIQGQLRAVTELLEQAEGRPGVAAGEPGGITLIVERHWPSSDDAEDLDETARQS